MAPTYGMPAVKYFHFWRKSRFMLCEIRPYDRILERVEHEDSVMLHHCFFTFTGP